MSELCLHCLLHLGFLHSCAQKLISQEDGEQWHLSHTCPILSSSPQASQLGVYRAFVDNYGVAMETAEKCCQANAQFAEISEVCTMLFRPVHLYLPWAGHGLVVGTPQPRRTRRIKPRFRHKPQPFPHASGLALSARCRDAVVSRQGASRIPGPQDQGLILGLRRVPRTDALLHCLCAVRGAHRSALFTEVWTLSPEVDFALCCCRADRTALRAVLPPTCQ